MTTLIFFRSDPLDGSKSLQTFFKKSMKPGPQTYQIAGSIGAPLKSQVILRMVYPNFLFHPK